MAKPKIQIFKEVCKAKGGSISLIAESLNVSRRTIERWIEKDEKFKECYTDVKESLIDIAETNMIRLIQGKPKIENNVFIKWIERPDSMLIKYMLSTKGKHRGYIERQEVTGKDGKDLIPKPRALSPAELKEYMKELENEF
jgi:predicted transcriptional regulator